MVDLPAGHLGVAAPDVPATVRDAIDRLPWVTAHCPIMPHQYVVSSWRECNADALDTILAMIRDSAETVLAYWRGYRTPTRYWHGPDGFRYWTSAGIFPGRGDTVLNRTNAPDDTRAVAEGAEPVLDWQGAPWAPNGSDIYEHVQINGKWAWWPTAAAIASGFTNCLACRRPPNAWTEDEKHVLGGKYGDATWTR